MGADADLNQPSPEVSPANLGCPVLHRGKNFTFPIPFATPVDRSETSTERALRFSALANAAGE